MSTLEGINEGWVIRAGVVAMFAVLGLLAGLSLVTQRRITDLAERAEAANGMAALLQDAHHWVQEEKSIEREYRIEGSSTVRADHARAGTRVVAALGRVPAQDRSPEMRRTASELLVLQREYEASAHTLFAAVDAEDEPATQRYEHEDIDPVYGVLEATVDRRARAATAAGLAYSTQLRHAQGEALTLITFAFAAGLGLLAWLTRLLLRFRRRLEGARRAEVERLAQIAMTDPLTGLRNHRAFQEDLARELQRAGRTGEPVALVLMDVDDLKAVNDARGHHHGDALILRCARAWIGAIRETDFVARVGGDEFLVLLPDSTPLDAKALGERVLGPAPFNHPFSMGIATWDSWETADALVRRADAAMYEAKAADGAHIVLAAAPAGSPG
jgi:diguanylate cyclase (GGDEF)-like protein